MITPSERYKRQISQGYVTTVSIRYYSSRHDLNALLNYKQQEIEQGRGINTNKENEFILSDFDDIRNNIYLNIKPNNIIELSAKDNLISELETKLQISNDKKITPEYDFSHVDIK